MNKQKQSNQTDNEETPDSFGSGIDGRLRRAEAGD
jgi:hypothetical protein